MGEHLLCPIQPGASIRSFRLPLSVLLQPQTVLYSGQKLLRQSSQLRKSAQVNRHRYAATIEANRGTYSERPRRSTQGSQLQNSRRDNFDSENEYSRQTRGQSGSQTSGEPRSQPIGQPQRHSSSRSRGLEAWQRRKGESKEQEGLQWLRPPLSSKGRREGRGEPGGLSMGAKVLLEKLRGSVKGREVLENWAKSGEGSKQELQEVLKELRREKEWAKAVEVYEWMLAAPLIGLTRHDYTLLLDAYGKSGQVSKAERCFSDMEVLGWERDLVLLNILMNVYANAGLATQTEGVLEKMESLNIKPDIVTFNTVLEAYAKEGLVEKAEELLRTMRKVRCTPTQATYTTLIGLYIQKGEQDSAAILFSDLEAAGYSLDTRLYTSMIGAYAKLRLWKEAENVYDRMVRAQVKPDQVTLNALLSAYGKGSQLERAETLLAEGLPKFRIKADKVSYNTVMAAYAARGEYISAERLVVSAERLGFEPDKHTYTGLLEAYGRAGKPKRALRVFERMLDAGISVDYVAYDTLLEGLGTAGLVEEMDRVLHHMQGSGFEINGATYLLLLRGYGQAGDFFRALLVLDQAREKGFLKGTAASEAYRCLLQAYAVHGMTTEALSAFKELLEWHVRKPEDLTDGVCLALLSACQNSREALEKARDLIEMSKQIAIS